MHVQKKIKLIAFTNAILAKDIMYSLMQQKNLWVDIITPDDFLNCKVDQQIFYLVGVSRDMNLRSEICKKIDVDGAQRHTFIAQDVIFGQNVCISPGCIIFASSMIYSDAFIDRDCIIAPYCLVSHKAKLGQGTVMQPYSMAAGSSNIGKWCKLNVRSTVLDHINIADYTEIGATSTVTKNIDVPGKYVGSPARRVVKSC